MFENDPDIWLVIRSQEVEWNQKKERRSERGNIKR